MSKNTRLMVTEAGQRIGKELAHDFADTLRDEGKDAFLEAVDEAIPHYLDFEMRYDTFAIINARPDDEMEKMTDLLHETIWKTVRRTPGIGSK